MGFEAAGVIAGFAARVGFGFSAGVGFVARVDLSTGVDFTELTTGVEFDDFVVELDELSTRVDLDEFSTETGLAIWGSFALTIAGSSRRAAVSRSWTCKSWISQPRNTSQSWTVSGLAGTAK